MLTFITPSIRTHKLIDLYNSIENSFTGEWEMIVLSPYDRPDNMDFDNVRWMHTHVNLVVCRQLGLIHAKGEFVTWAVDDSVYLPDELDRAFDMCDRDTIVSMLLTEGDNYDPETLNPAHYRAGVHRDIRLPYVPRETLLINFAICWKQSILDVGGWDCRFEGLGMADVDLSIRLKKSGIKEKITDFQVVKCEHMPGMSGDHGPVHLAHFSNDLPLIMRLYCNPDRPPVHIDNYKDAPLVWERRFGK